MTPPPMTIVAFDYGTRFLGVAVGQTVTGTANPLPHLKMRDGGPPWDDIQALLREWQPGLVLVGLPLNMDGSESDMSRQARRFANRLHGRYGFPVEHQDERLSSYEARQQSAENNRQGGAIDSAAARVILEHWLAEQSAPR